MPRKTQDNPARDARIAQTRAATAARSAERRAAHAPAAIAVTTLDPLLPSVTDNRLTSEHLTAVVTAIAAGASLNACARSLNTHATVLLRQLERHALDEYILARRVAAQHYDEQALQTIADVRDDASAVSMSRAREIASHLRWRCKAIAPRDYGDDKRVDVSVEHKQVLDPAALSIDQRAQLRSILESARAGRTLEHDAD